MRRDCQCSGGLGDTLLDVIGVAWPNVDEDAYRDMADALRDFASDLEDDMVRRSARP